MTTWSDLSRRAAEATGGDRELDRAVLVALMPKAADAYYVKEDDGSYVVSDDLLTPYTSSVDAMLALIADKLPSWSVFRLADETDGWAAELVSSKPEGWSGAKCATPALCLLACFTAAKDAEEKGNENGFFVV